MNLKNRNLHNNEVKGNNIFENITKIQKIVKNQKKENYKQIKLANKITADKMVRYNNLLAKAENLNPADRLLLERKYKADAMAKANQNNNLNNKVKLNQKVIDDINNQLPSSRFLDFKLTKESQKPIIINNKSNNSIIKNNSIIIDNNSNIENDFDTDIDDFDDDFETTKELQNQDIYTKINSKMNEKIFNKEQNILTDKQFLY